MSFHTSIVPEQKRFENIIGIYPSPEDTIESRRTRILSRWNDTLPYTFRYLEGVIAVLTGGNYEIIKDFGNYKLEIITHIGNIGGVDDLGYILKTVTPCNFVVISTNSLEVITAGNARISSALIPTLVYMVTNDFETMYSVTGAMTSKSTLVQTSVSLVTNDFEAAYSANGQANSGSTLVQVNVHFVTNDFESTYSMNGQINNGSNAAVVSEFLITNDFEATVSVEGSATSKTASVIVTEYQI